MSLIHLLTYGLVVALVQSLAHSNYAIFLAEDKLGSAIILFANLSLHFLQLLPCAVAQSLECPFRMLGSNVLNHILATVATVIVR